MGPPGFEDRMETALENPELIRENSSGDAKKPCADSCHRERNIRFPRFQPENIKPYEAFPD